ncbi:DNA polymerase III delta prime subunit [Hephaestia caeni]|uniref:DNA polymerase III delta prime subunit n=1 Tax=Hephaestia caeni TaxID=645617 RepID=A0A397PF18_9SPHN|nr:AAA family ATPase [Hephaestia caeni]RIA45825.1 DNA polymerase III delta prime subunit [Hephaestia caeni]
MTSLVGNEAARATFLAAMRGPAMHHAWLFTGPEGVGKGTFARAAAVRLLAEAVAPGALETALDLPADNPTRKLIEAGSHPDFRLLQRLPKDADKPGENLARSITIAQVRTLQAMFATTPSMSSRRVVLIDAVDDLERGGANALLKSLEEPPAGTIFLLVSHAPGRLLPTIRSRCRLLRFEPLPREAMTSLLRDALPQARDEEIAALIAAGQGSPGRALGFAGLDMAALDRALATIAAEGDPTNAERSKLAKALAPKAAQPRYEAFLDRTPSFIAAAAGRREGERLRTALDAHEAARSLAASARALSLDAQATAFEMAGIVARLAR